MIQQNVGPYLAARTKIEKSEAIALIVDKVHQTSPHGGFIKKDPATGRWFRIKENEARDKVGHAIRKAVQRLEETKPKLAARIKKEYSSSQSEQGKQPSDSPTLENAAASAEKPSPAISRPSPAISRLENEEKEKPSPCTKAVEPTVSWVHASARRHTMEPFSATVNSALSQDPTKIALAQLLANSSATALTVSSSAQRATFPARQSLLGFPALSNSLPGHNVSVFPSPSNVCVVDNPVRLVAASMLGQPSIFQRATPLSHAYNQYFGLNPASVPGNKLWLTAALRQQQETEKAKELEYARRLALTALHDLSQSAVASSEGARPRGRKTSMDGEDSTSRT